MKKTEGLKNRINNTIAQEVFADGEDGGLGRRVRKLGRILKKIPGFRFNMQTLNGRIVFQKTIYFLKVFGIDLKYDYSWYIHGPYSTLLASDGFELVDSYDELEAMELTGKKEKLFKEFIEFLGTRKNSRYWLELLGSILFLREIRPSYSKEEIFEVVLQHQDYFTPEKFEEAWNYLVNYNLV